MGYGEMDRLGLISITFNLKWDMMIQEKEYDREYSIDNGSD